MSALDHRITAVMRDVFRNDRLEVTDQTTPADIPGWDSLAHVRLITALEAEFDIKLGVREVVTMSDVAAIRRVLAAKTSE
jgi:acyl carrier protein